MSVQPPNHKDLPFIKSRLSDWPNLTVTHTFQRWCVCLQSDMRMNLVDRSAEGLSHLSTSKLILLLLALAHTCMLPCFYKPPFSSPLTHSCQLTWEQLYSAPKSRQKENKVLWTLSIKKIQGQECFRVISERLKWKTTHTTIPKFFSVYWVNIQNLVSIIVKIFPIFFSLCPCVVVSLGGYCECFGPNKSNEECSGIPQIHQCDVAIHSPLIFCSNSILLYIRWQLLFLHFCR